MTTSLVKPGTPGRYRFIRQQDTEASKPYTSCRIVELMMQLLDAGLEFPDDTKFLERFRKATGVAEVTSSGKTQGTSAADVLFAAKTMLPWAPIEFGPWGEAAFLDMLQKHDMTASVAVSYAEMPSSLRTYSPNFRGRHQILIRMARKVGDAWEVLWVDCLGPRGHKGKWVKWSLARTILAKSGSTSAGRVFATTIERGSALSTFMSVAEVYAPPAEVVIPKGVEVFSISKVTGKLVKEKNTGQASKAHTTGRVSVANYPDASPSGDFIQVIDGGLTGKYLRASKVNVNPAPMPGDCQPAIDAAVAPLNAEIKSQETAIEAALAALQAVV